MKNTRSYRLMRASLFARRSQLGVWVLLAVFPACVRTGLDPRREDVGVVPGADAGTKDSRALDQGSDEDAATDAWVRPDVLGEQLDGRAVDLGGLPADAGVEVDAALLLEVFAYAGTDREYLVAPGCQAITVRLWGAGGAGGRMSHEYTDIPSGAGGGGAFVSARLDVAPGESLAVRVGGGGRGDGSPSFGGGGASEAGEFGAGGGGGGGTFVLRGATILAAAGGGGGGGIGGGWTCAGGSGGAGGAPALGGADSVCAGERTRGGAGATANAGGSGGASSLLGGPGGSGRFQAGGAGAVGNECPGGGGGGGHYGGGGGGGGFSDTGGGGGGGGSSHALGDRIAYRSGSGQSPGGADEPGYVEGVGRGGDRTDLPRETGHPGGDGYAIISCP